MRRKELPGLSTEEVADRRDRVSFLEPRVNPLFHRIRLQSRFTLTWISPSTTVTGYCGSGRGGGPPITFPSRSNRPPWQGQKTSPCSFLQSTRQPRWVQMAENERY